MAIKNGIGYCISPPDGTGDLWLYGDERSSAIRAAEILEGHGYVLKHPQTTPIPVEERALRKKAEEALRLNEARLDALLSISERYESPVEDLAQFAIDETVRLTGSAIGYLHFVNDAEDGFLSFFWSQGSRKTCEAVEVMDYSLDAAGIWADSLRTKRPVVHNDYPNEPTQRGLPQGHLPLTRHMGAPVMRKGKVVAVCGVANKETEYNAADLRQMLLFANRLWGIVEYKRSQAALEAANQELSRLAGTDPLTGLANRRTLESRLDSQWRDAVRQGGELAVLMVDIDYFKAFNDSYGHQAGDAALKLVGGELAKAARRPLDLAARYGGEEFSLVFPDTGIDDAQRLAEGLVRSVEALALAHSGSSCAPVLTISVGVAATKPREAEGNGLVDLVAAADAALYRAKMEGRNRAVLAGEA